MKFIVVLVFTSIYSFCALAQESTGSEELNRHKISLELSHTHVPASFGVDGKSWQVLASWGVNYDFRLNEDWALGLHNDLVIQDFAYEDGEGIVKERSKPLASALVITRRLTEHLSVVGGGGMEVAPEGTLGLLRIGFDCGWELPKAWELSVSLMADFKIHAYNAYVLGIGLGKAF